MRSRPWPRSNFEKMPSSGFAQILTRWRVRAGSLGIILVVLLAKPTMLSLLVGGGVCFLGIGLRTWAAGHLRKEKALAISGPYQYCRNPLYLGNLILGIGATIGASSWWVATIFVAYFSLFYPVIIRREMNRMKELFPDKYEAYKKFVPLFCPRLKPQARSQDAAFSWHIYKKNREYRALIAAIIFWGILLGKMLLLP